MGFETNESSKERQARIAQMERRERRKKIRRQRRIQRAEDAVTFLLPYLAFLMLLVNILIAVWVVGELLHNIRMTDTAVETESAECPTLSAEDAQPVLMIDDALVFFRWRGGGRVRIHSFPFQRDRSSELRGTEISLWSLRGVFGGLSVDAWADRTGDPLQKRDRRRREQLRLLPDPATLVVEDGGKHRCNRPDGPIWKFPHRLRSADTPAWRLRMRQPDRCAYSLQHRPRRRERIRERRA